MKKLSTSPSSSAALGFVDDRCDAGDDGRKTFDRVLLLVFKKRLDLGLNDVDELAIVDVLQAEQPQADAPQVFVLAVGDVVTEIVPQLILLAVFAELLVEYVAADVVGITHQ